MVIVCVDKDCGYFKKTLETPKEELECPHCFNLLLIYTDTYWETEKKKEWQKSKS